MPATDSGVVTFPSMYGFESTEFASPCATAAACIALACAVVTFAAARFSVAFVRDVAAAVAAPGKLAAATSTSPVSQHLFAQRLNTSSSSCPEIFG